MYFTAFGGSFFAIGETPIWASTSLRVLRYRRNVLSLTPASRASSDLYIAFITEPFLSKVPGEYKDQAFKLKLEILKSDLKTRQDSLNYVKNLRQIYEQNPNNDTLLENMYNVLSALGEKAEANKVLDDVLAKDPNNFVALADKGIAAMGEERVDEAIQWLEKANAVKPDNAAVPRLRSRLGEEDRIFPRSGSEIPELPGSVPSLS